MIEKIEQAYYGFVMIVIVVGVLCTLYDWITTGSVL